MEEAREERNMLNDEYAAPSTLLQFIFQYLSFS